MREIVEFRAEGDEPVENDEAAEALPLASVIHRLVVSGGWEAGNLCRHSFYGWAFTARRQRYRSCLTLARGPSVDAWALYVDKQGWFGRRDPDLAEAIVNELAQMPQFSEARITHIRRLKDFAGIALAKRDPEVVNHGAPISDGR